MVNPSLIRMPNPVTPAEMLPSFSPLAGSQTASPVPMSVDPSASAGGDLPGAASSHETVPPSSAGTVRPAPVQAEPSARKRLRLDAVQTDASGSPAVSS